MTAHSLNAFFIYVILVSGAFTSVGVPPPADWLYSKSLMARWRPYPEGATNGDQLPQMVSVVVGNEQHLAEYGLPVAVRDRGKQDR